LPKAYSSLGHEVTDIKYVLRTLNMFWSASAQGYQLFRHLRSVQQELLCILFQHFLSAAVIVAWPQRRITIPTVPWSQFYWQ